jgi:hypothetical protein
VGQFNFECCPLVQEIISVIHYLPCVYHCVCLLRIQHWEFISLPCPLCLGQVQCFTCPLFCPCFITVCCFLFSLAGQLSFGCCSLALEISPVIHYLPCFGECLIATRSQSSLPFLCLLTDSSVLSLVPFPSPFLWCSFSVLPAPSVCV